MSDVLKVQSVHKSYQQGPSRIEVLKGIDLELCQGQTVAVIGKSGSGKSTFLSLIGGLDHPDRGEIHLKGRPIHSLSEQDLALLRGLEMGIIFQQFHLMSSMTALENVKLPLEILGRQATEIADLAQQALVKVGLDHRGDHFPHQLSGGERQRVAIARAIIHKPALLLADEPSGNLDNETGEKVMNLLFDLVDQEKMAMVLVTHSQEFTKYCDRALRLDHGMLTSDVF